ncbi:MAG: bifunctional methylenetetrahydrofolate dehydrogenase/methenyltetrahydrofolate cyclohydrolase FolD [Candidatus Melainabacteria bacterium]|nr:bifunctional methylenetetrahydrofolate dehydrogenase/methenyltetrahydrofolate cyclohydrolase FolD [Candidatus Melainabacteria bacterium]
MLESGVAQILDGKAVAASVRGKLKATVDDVVSRGLRRPGLAVILVGDNPASQIYVRNKIEACRKTGIESHCQKFPVDVSQRLVLESIRQLNKDTTIDGILVQLPLPEHLAADAILAELAPDKDVDGLHPLNMGLLLMGRLALRPCTPQGIMVLLEYYGIGLAGKRAVVIGRSNLVGKPIALMLMEKNATVTVCHSKSAGLEELARSADVLVVAVGRQSLVRGSWVKPGAAVVDVGIHRLETTQGDVEIVGDVHFQEVAQVASYITPVPGGIGPMTVAMLLSNTVRAYQEHIMLR